MEKVYGIMEEDILKPSDRKLTFLYWNLCDPTQKRVCVGRSLSNVSFGNPEEALAIIEWKNEERFNVLWETLNDKLELGKYKENAPVYNLDILKTLLNKHNGNLKAVKKEFIIVKETRGDITFLQGIYVMGLTKAQKKENTFGSCLHMEDYERLSTVKDELIERMGLSHVIESNIRVEHTRPIPRTSCSILTVKISGKGESCVQKNCLVKKGIELLNEKKPYHSRLMFWFDKDERYFRVGGYLESPNIQMTSTRVNATLIV